MPIAKGPFPFFWRTPITYIRWAAHEKPALLWSVIIGGTGPIMLLAVPIIRRRMGYELRPQIPMTYPSAFGLCPFN